MTTNTDLGHLGTHLSLRLTRLLSPASCRTLIERHDQAVVAGCVEQVSAKIIEECARAVFTDHLAALLRGHYPAGYQSLWPTYNVVDASPSRNSRWHLDSGIAGTLKLLIYLNPVAEHGANTPTIDRERTEKLRANGALPLEHETRREDLTSDLKSLSLPTDILTHDLEAGDGLLFDPLRLAHRCQPPRAGKVRHSVCFTLVPGIRI
ncbi:MAG: hypothetical protein ACPGU7_05305 [Gammaproteobacteria bacterium]